MLVDSSFQNQINILNKPVTFELYLSVKHTNQGDCYDDGLWFPSHSCMQVIFLCL